MKARSQIKPKQAQAKPNQSKSNQNHKSQPNASRRAKTKPEAPSQRAGLPFLPRVCSCRHLPTAPLQGDALQGPRKGQDVP